MSAVGMVGQRIATAAVLICLAGCMGPSGPTEGDLTTPSQIRSGAVKDGLRITAFGPRGLSASESFYAQQNGEVAMWLEVNRSVAGLDAVIWLAGRPLERTVINRKIVTGIIPASLKLRPGVHKLQLRLGPKGAQGATPEVEFLVEPGHEWSGVQ